MKKRSFLLFGLMAVVLGIGTISASAQGKVLRADIPFEFTVGKVALPAGEYSITLPPTGGANTVSFRSVDGESFGMALTNWVNSNKAKASNGLTFIKSGDKYHLYQVHVEGLEIGREVLRSGKLVQTEIARKTVEPKPARS